MCSLCHFVFLLWNGVDWGNCLCHNVKDIFEEKRQLFSFNYQICFLFIWNSRNIHNVKQNHVSFLFSFSWLNISVSFLAFAISDNPKGHHVLDLMKCFTDCKWWMDKSLFLTYTHSLSSSHFSSSFLTVLRKWFSTPQMSTFIFH